MAERTDTNRYGGWSAKKFESAGYFRVEHDGTRWWLVTPGGNAFLSFGVNHYHWFWWNQDYNREYWLKKFGAKEPRDQAWVSGYRSMASNDAAYLGLNTLGIHTDPGILTGVDPILPFVARFDPVDIPHYKVAAPEKFPDIFSLDFDRQCDSKARELVKPLANEPGVLGFSMTDCPIFTDEDARERGMTVYGAPRPELPTWPRLLRNSGASSDGKQKYVHCVRKLHRNNISSFNSVYSTDFASWDSLASATNWRERTDYNNETELRDNTEFLRECVDTYYRKAKEALRRYDNNHLFFGDKINANTNTLDTVLDITVSHTDIVFYQMYARYPDQQKVLDRWTSRIDKPFLNGDSSFSFVSEMMPHPYGPHADDQRERAQWTKEFVESAFARTDFVGWHICGILDSWKIMAGKSDKQHAGLMSPTGDYYPEMERTVRDLSDRLYKIATNQ